jgi:hypothetical protein
VGEEIRKEDIITVARRGARGYKGVSQGMSKSAGKIKSQKPLTAKDAKTRKGTSRLMDDDNCRRYQRSSLAAQGASVFAVAATDGVEQLGRVVPYTILEDDFDVFDVGDLLGRIAFDDNQVGVFSGGDGADLLVAT